MKNYDNEIAYKTRKAVLNALKILLHNMKRLFKQSRVKLKYKKSKMPQRSNPKVKTKKKSSRQVIKLQDLKIIKICKDSTAILFDKLRGLFYQN